MTGACSLARWRCELNACSDSSVNFTYRLRAERRTGLRSNMPLQHKPPLMMSAGRVKSLGPSGGRATPARWAPEGGPGTEKAGGVAPEKGGVGENPGEGRRDR